MRTSLGTLILIVVAVIAGSSIILSSQVDAYPEDTLPITSSGYERIPVALGGALVTADIADTDTLRTLGLSGRKHLTTDTGMLFVFPSNARHTFWMKDMLFPIDIIWFSADKKIVGILKNATPDTYPQSFAPSAPARYALEVPAGFAKEHSLSPGMSGSW